jgi:thiamine biosynthesis lipoprotein
LDTSSDFELLHEGPLWRGRFSAMANPCEVLCETIDAGIAREVVRCAAREARRVERKFSRYRQDNIVHAINTSGGRPIELDQETARLVEFGDALWRLSEGAFDLTSGVLRKAWRFEPGATIPNEAIIEETRRHIGWKSVTWQPPILQLPAGMQLDFGAIGKEYAVDQAVDQISAAHDAPTLVNFGGDLRCCGTVPRQGSWQIGIESPAHERKTQKRIRLTSGALATSGDTYRFIEHGGRRFGHILDARTGWPVPGAPRSVTVAAPTCSQAGSLSTLAMLKGEQAEAFLDGESARFWCLR